MHYEQNPSPDQSAAAARQDAIDINDFVYAATGARVRRLTMPDGEHWFPASDLLSELGYTNPTKTLADHVPQDWRSSLGTLTGRYGFDVPAGHSLKKSMNMVNLTGLIMLVSAATKPSTRLFKRWITEVIVTIQREGSYSLEKAEVQPTAPDSPTAYAMPKQVADAIVRLEEHNLRLGEDWLTAREAARREDLRFYAEARDFHAETRDFHDEIRAFFAEAREFQSGVQRCLEEMVRLQREQLQVLRGLRAGSSEPQVLQQPEGPQVTAEGLLAEWRGQKLAITGEVWAVAAYLAPGLAERGEVRYPLETIATRTGLTQHQVRDCLRMMLKRGCIRQAGVDDRGAPVYVRQGR